MGRQLDGIIRRGVRLAEMHVGGIFDVETQCVNRNRRRRKTLVNRARRVSPSNYVEMPTSPTGAWRQSAAAEIIKSAGAGGWSAVLSSILSAR